MKLLGNETPQNVYKDFIRFKKSRVRGLDGVRVK